jgi:putative heme iron utilization protein
MNPTALTPSSAATARRLTRELPQAAFGTLLDGRPYVSLVLCALDEDGSPLLLLSDLAQHAKNLSADPRVSLLFDGTAGLAERLTGERLTVLGSAVPCDDPAARARYLELHPSAAVYAGFGDFRLYRVELERGQLVAGFGKIDWIEAGELRSPA